MSEENQTTEDTQTTPVKKARRSSRAKRKALEGKDRLTLPEVLRLAGIHDLACAECMTIANANALAAAIMNAIVDACKDGRSVNIYGMGSFKMKHHKGRKQPAALPKILEKAEEALGSPLTSDHNVFIEYSGSRRLTFSMSPTLSAPLNIGVKPPVITVEDDEGKILAKV